MSRILIVDLAGPDSLDLVSAARGRGFEVHAVLPRQNADLAFGRKVEGVLRVDFSDINSAVSEIIAYARQYNIQGITTANEFLTPVAALAAAGLGLPGNDATQAMAARSKVAMLHRFRQCMVSVPATIIASCRSDVFEAIGHMREKYPFVVKPPESAGSRGVSIVRNAEEIVPALEAVWAQDDVYGIPSDKRVMVQEYIDGEEYSVESVTQAGITKHICITRKITTKGGARVEIGHSVPARIGPDVEERVLREAGKAISAVGIENSVSHCEIIVRQDGSCVVLEIGARVGAGRIAVLVELALGVNLSGASVDIAMGRKADVECIQTAWSAVRFPVAPQSGTLLSIKNMPPVGVDVKASELIRQINSHISGPVSNRSRVGYFILTGNSEEVVNRKADDLLANIEVVVASGLFRPWIWASELAARVIGA